MYQYRRQSAECLLVLIAVHLLMVGSRLAPVFVWVLGLARPDGFQPAMPCIEIQGLPGP